MTVMQATAVISAVDRASGVFAKVASAARVASGRYATAMAAFSSARSKLESGALSIGMPAAMSLASFGFNQYEWEGATKLYQAIGHVADETMAKLKVRISEVSVATATNRLELMEGAAAWRQIGGTPETYIRNMEIAARAAKMTGLSISEQVTESTAVMRAFEGDSDIFKRGADGSFLNADAWAERYKHYEEVFTVASKNMKGGGHAFGEAISSAAPLARAMHISFEQMAALIQSLGGQFESGRIGRAFRTGFTRISSNKPDVEVALSTMGLDRSELFSYDWSKVLDPSRLTQGLRRSGQFHITPAIERLIASDLAAADPSKGASILIDKLNQDLGKALGDDAKGAQNKKLLKAGITSSIQSAADGLSLDAIFDKVAPFSTNATLMSMLFGTNYEAEWMDLLKQREQYHAFLQKDEHADGGLATMWGIFNGDNYKQSFDRMSAAWTDLLGAIGDSGATATATKMFDSMTNAFEAIKRVDPALLNGAFWGAAGLGGLGAASFAVSSLYGLLANPISLTVIGAGALYEAYENWDKLKKAADEALKFTVDIVWPQLPQWVQDFFHWMKPTGHATGRGYNAGVRGTDWLDPEPVPYVRGPSRGRGAGQLMLPQLSLLDLSQRAVSVTGSATATIRNELVVKVDGPGSVTKQTGNGTQVDIPLNTGRSMPDTGGYHGRGSR